MAHIITPQQPQAMRCGNCGGLQFSPGVVLEAGQARIRALACTACAKQYHVDDAAYVGQRARLTPHVRQVDTTPVLPSKPAGG